MLVWICFFKPTVFVFSQRWPAQKSPGRKRTPLLLFHLLMQQDRLILIADDRKEVHAWKWSQSWSALQKPKGGCQCAHELPVTHISMSPALSERLLFPTLCSWFSFTRGRTKRGPLWNICVASEGFNDDNKSSFLRLQDIREVFISCKDVTLQGRVRAADPEVELWQPEDETLQNKSFCWTWVVRRSFDRIVLTVGGQLYEADVLNLQKMLKCNITVVRFSRLDSYFEMLKTKLHVFLLRLNNHHILLVGTVDLCLWD